MKLCLTSFALLLTIPLAACAVPTTLGPSAESGGSTTGSSGASTSTGSTTHADTGTPTTTAAADPGTSGTTATSADPGTTSDPSTGTSTGTSDGSTTDATTGSAGGGTFCKEQCSADIDCHYGGGDAGFTCMGGQCGADNSCDSDLDCTVRYGVGWDSLCSKQADCSPSQACIDIGGGEGHCAFKGPEKLCDMFIGDQDLMSWPTIEGGMNVMVCTSTDFKCKDHDCQNPCDDDSECGGQTPHCDVGSGVCRCEADAECAGTQGDGGAVCNDGVCGCTVDADCANLEHADSCQNGLCGCSTAAVCAAHVFDGTKVVCAER